MMRFGNTKRRRQGAEEGEKIMGNREGLIQHLGHCILKQLPCCHGDRTSLEKWICHPSEVNICQKKKKKISDMITIKSEGSLQCSLEILEKQESVEKYIIFNIFLI